MLWFGAKTAAPLRYTLARFWLRGKMSGDDSSSKFKLGGTPTDFYVKQEKLSNEYQIAIEGMTLVRERLAKCFREEGVNHYVKCKDIREQYFALCNDRFRGMVFPEGEEPASRRVPGLIPAAPKPQVNSYAAED